jgi:phage shock protein A
LEAIETQLSLAFTLCETADTEIRADEFDTARQLLGKLRHHAKTIGFHVNEPSHVPKSAVAGLRKKVTQLEKRIEEVESLLHQRSA